MSISIIDWYAEGQVPYFLNTYRGNGAEEEPYILNLSNELTIDALHPNEIGAKLLTITIYKVIKLYLDII